MFSRRFIIISAIISMLATACAAQSVLECTNDLRVRYGLPALTESRALSDYCLLYAAAMIDAGRIGHDIWPQQFKEQVIGLRAREHGEDLSDMFFYENVYCGPSRLTRANKELAEVWMDSAPHRKAILLPAALYIGVGYWRSGSMTYLCVVIACP